MGSLLPPPRLAHLDLAPFPNSKYELSASQKKTPELALSSGRIKTLLLIIGGETAKDLELVAILRWE